MDSLGKKLSCLFCGKKYYDFNIQNASCPRCGGKNTGLQGPIKLREIVGGEKLVRRPNSERPTFEKIADMRIIKGVPSKARPDSFRAAIIEVVRNSTTIASAKGAPVHFPQHEGYKITMSDIHHCLDNKYIVLTPSDQVPYNSSQQLPEPRPQNPIKSIVPMIPTVTNILNLQSWIQKATMKYQELKYMRCSIHGIKPFYVNIRSFDANRQTIMVLGINPGGDSVGEAKERALGYMDKIMDPNGGPYCAIISGKWGEFGAEKQRYASRLRSYISSLLGWHDLRPDDSRFTLLPLGNLVPFRAPDTKVIEEEAWVAGVCLGLELLRLTRPQFLLLIGTAEERSCWGELQRIGDMDANIDFQNHHAGYTIPYAKQMTITWNETSSTTQVLAIPHPKFQITNEKFHQQLAGMSEGFPEWKGIHLCNPYGE